jgi:hypothetical protein
MGGIMNIFAKISALLKKQKIIESEDIIPLESPYGTELKLRNKLSSPIINTQGGSSGSAGTSFYNAVISARISSTEYRVTVNGKENQTLFIPAAVEEDEILENDTGITCFKGTYNELHNVYIAVKAIGIIL